MARLRVIFGLWCQALRVAVDGLFGGTRLFVSRSCGLQAAGDAAEEIGFGAGSGESDAHTLGRLRDASGNLEQSCA